MRSREGDFRPSSGLNKLAAIKNLYLAAQTSPLTMPPLDAGVLSLIPLWNDQWINSAILISAAERTRGISSVYHGCADSPAPAPHRSKLMLICNHSWNIVVGRRCGDSDGWGRRDNRPLVTTVVQWKCSALFFLFNWRSDLPCSYQRESRLGPCFWFIASVNTVYPVKIQVYIYTRNIRWGSFLVSTMEYFLYDNLRFKGHCAAHVILNITCHLLICGSIRQVAKLPKASMHKAHISCNIASNSWYSNLFPTIPGFHIKDASFN